MRADHMLALMLSAQVITSLKRKESFIAEIHLSWWRSRRDGLNASMLESVLVGLVELALRPERLQAGIRAG